MAFTSETAKEAGKIGGKRPKTRDVVTQHIIAELNEVDPTTKVTRARMLAKLLVNKALEGDLQAQKECIDRSDGKPTQAVDVTHDGEITHKSAAISFLDDLVAEATGTAAGGVSPNPRPN